MLLKASIDSIIGAITKSCHKCVTEDRYFADNFKQAHVNLLHDKTTVEKFNSDLIIFSASCSRYFKKVSKNALDVILIRTVCEIYSNIDTNNFILSDVYLKGSQ